MSFTVNIGTVVAENRNKLLGKHPSWQRVRLRDIAAILNGFPFDSSRFSKTKGTPLLRIRDILAGKTTTFYDGDLDPAFLVKPGDIIVGMDGDFNCVAWPGEPALLNQRVCKLTVDETCFSKQFLRYVLPGYLAAINEQTSSVTVKHLSSHTIGDIPLPLPPLPEQLRIAKEIENQVSRIEEGTAKLRRAQAGLQRYRASVLRSVYTSKWPVLTLADCFKLQRGRFLHRPRNDPRFFGGAFPFVQIGDLPPAGGPITSYTQTLNEDGLAISKIFPKGTILIAIVGATIGNTGILTFESCAPDSLVGLESENPILCRYAEIYLRSKKHLIRAASYASGGQPNINLPFLRAYRWCKMLVFGGNTATWARARRTL